MKKIFLFFIFLLITGCIEGSSSNNTDSLNNNIDKKKSYFSIKKGEEFSYVILDKDFYIKNPPKGMAAFPNGEITWTPTNDQEGSYDINIYKGNSLISTIHINVSGQDIKYDGYFVDLNSDAHGDGSPEQPFNRISSACKTIKKNNYSKLNVYLRGGIYKNENFGQSLDNSVMEFIKGCNGTIGKYINIRPWGNERVLILSDGFSAFAIRESSYLTIKNLEFKGIADKIKFEEALDYWWNSKRYYKGSGISINKECHDIVIQKNVIHDFPGAGIAVHNSDGIKIENNIVYNNAWWTVAGTGGAVLTQSKELTDSESYIKGNLLFDNESRIFSHVFQKGFSHLVIDEGEALLVQEGKDTEGNSYISSYNKHYHILDNFLAFNGKGIVVNKADKAFVKNNSLYLSNSLRVGSYSSDVYIQQNAVQVKDNGKWVSIARNDTKRIYVRNNFYNRSATAKYDTTNPDIYLEDNIPVNKVFEDPSKFKLVNQVKIAKVGASTEQWDILEGMLKKYDITITPTGWDYSEEKMIFMKKKIIEDAKNLGPDVIIDCSQLNENHSKVIIKNIPESFVKKNRLPSPSFELILEYPYDGEKCDIL